MALWNHVRKRQPDGPPRLIQGTENDLKLMVRLARAKGAKYAIRHYYLNPAEMVTNDQLQGAVTALGREFSFDPATAVIVAHDKPRHGNTAESEHWHVLVPEVSAITGKTLDAHNFKRRHEKISRTLECEWGHQIIKGRHNFAVVNALVNDGAEDVARELVQAGITDGDPAFSAYTSDQRRKLERKQPKLAMPALTLSVQDAWRRADNMQAFQSALSENGMRARLGDKKAEWIVEVHDAHKGEWAFVGGLKRLVQERKDNLETRITDWEKADAKKNAKTRTVAGGRHTRNPRGNDGPQELAGIRQQGVEPRGVLRAEISNRNRQPVGPAGGETASRGQPHRDNQGSVGIHRGLASAPRRQAGPFDRATARIRLAERIAITRLNLKPMRPEIGVLAIALRNGPPVQQAEHVRTITAIPHRDRSAFRASLIRKAYHLNWLPESVVQNIKFVKVEPDRPCVTLTLTTGTRIIDTGDRISLVGEVDDVSVDELVACVTRRGWKSVELTGDDEFRREATRRLMRLAPPVEVKDNPLDPLERSAIRIEMAGDVEGVDWENLTNSYHSYRPRSW
jgi:hypothetical protein